MATFIAFCSWEVFPTILVLVLFGTVHSTKLGMFSNICHCFSNSAQESDYPSVQYTRVSQDGGRIGKLEDKTNLLVHPSFSKAQLFNDPRRYDSDDESTAASLKNTNSLNTPYNISSSAEQRV